MENVMVDIETLGTAPGSIILSIGAVEFGWDYALNQGAIGREFYKVINTEVAAHHGLTTDRDTLRWWDQQSTEARKVLEEARNGGGALPDVLREFNDWLELTKPAPQYTKIWGNGADFDTVLMQAAYRAAGIKPLWKYNNVRCYRTLKTLVSVALPCFEGTQHNALADAKYQAHCACLMLRGLGVF